MRISQRINQKYIVLTHSELTDEYYCDDGIYQLYEEASARALVLKRRGVKEVRIASFDMKESEEIK